MSIKKIISNHADTVFGTKHQFKSIKDFDTYKQMVPLHNYDSLSEYIEIQRNTQNTMLTSDQPIFYLKTSGTTSSEKFIPYTLPGYKQLSRQQNLAAYQCKRIFPKAFKGNQLLITGSPVEGYFSNEIPFGSATGVMRDSMQNWMQNKFSLPACVSEIKDYDLKYQLIALFAIIDPTITHIITANPSSLIRLMETINNHSAKLIKALETGDLKCLNHKSEVIPEALNNEIHRQLEQKIQHNHRYGNNLQRIIEKHPEKEILCTDLWPNLALITTWTSGSVCIPLSGFLSKLPESVKVYDPGYLASECRFTVTIDTINQSGLPLLNDHYYEFFDTKTWSSLTEKERAFHCQSYIPPKSLHELQVNEEYYIIVTTNTGLYRYFMNDIVTVTGFHKKTPLLKFLQKGKGVTNLTGEKLHESQLLKSVESVCHAHDIKPTYIHGLANEKKCSYQVFIESHKENELNTTELENLENEIDHIISESNAEYKEKRASNRLKQLKLSFLKPGCYEQYKQHLLKKGQREAQFKTISIGYVSSNEFEFEKYTIQSSR